MRTCVFYVWVPGDRFKRHTERFARAYAEHPAGVAHQLVALCKADRIPGPLPELPITQCIAVGEGGFDLGPFLALAPRFRDYERLVLLGSYARPLCEGWLARLTAAGPLSSATGSFEVRPHLRTNCISLAPELLEGIAPCLSKEDCWAAEHGERSIYLQAKTRGVHGVVVGREGVYAEVDWPSSGTYRSGEQQNLICADNHTDAYNKATAAQKRKLEADTWGPRGTSGRAPITVLTVTIPGREAELARNVASVFAQTVPVQRQLCLAHRGGGHQAMIAYSAAKNNLLRAVDTEWVAVLNDDDTWLPDHVQSMLSELAGADVAYSWDAGGSRPRENCNGWTRRQLIARLEQGNFLDGNCLIRTEKLRAAGGFPLDWEGGSPTDGGHYAGGPANYEDWELWRRLARAGARFRCVPKETWCYSVSSNGRLSR